MAPRYNGGPLAKERARNDRADAVVDLGMAPLGLVRAVLRCRRPKCAVPSLVVGEAVLLVATVFAAVWHAEVVAHRVGEPFGHPRSRPCRDGHRDGAD